MGGKLAGLGGAAWQPTESSLNCPLLCLMNPLPKFGGQIPAMMDEPIYRFKEAHGNQLRAPFSPHLSAFWGVANSGNDGHISWDWVFMVTN